MAHPGPFTAPARPYAPEPDASVYRKRVREVACVLLLPRPGLAGFLGFLGLLRRHDLLLLREVARRVVRLGTAREPELGGHRERRHLQRAPLPRPPAAHPPCPFRRRVRKRQPEGMFVGEGTSPARMIRSRCSRASGSGTGT